MGCPNELLHRLDNQQRLRVLQQFASKFFTYFYFVKNRANANYCVLKQYVAPYLQVVPESSAQLAQSSGIYDCSTGQ